MESAVLFALAARHGVAAATALVVSDRAFGDRARLEEEHLHRAELELGRLALRAVPAA
jgi:purine-nucleoside phosphorylase